MKYEVRNLDNEPVGEIDLDDRVFALPERRDILSRVVRWQRAKRRSGNHQVKTRAMRTGGGKKPWRQKGTGRARQGTMRAPQFRKGGIVHGPHKRDHSHDLPKKVRRLGLKTALSLKARRGQLIVVDELAAQEGKTREVAGRMAALGATNALVIDGEKIDSRFQRAVNNLPTVDVLPQIGANVHDILRRDRLVLSRAAVQQLQERLA